MNLPHEVEAEEVHVPKRHSIPKFGDMSGIVFRPSDGILLVVGLLGLMVGCHTSVTVLFRTTDTGKAPVRAF